MLALALIVAGPGAGIAQDMAFHSAAGHGRAERALAEASAPSEAADPGLDCHVHCGCHQMAALEPAPVAPVPDPCRPLYARTASAPVPVVPDRLARPPRA